MKNKIKEMRQYIGKYVLWNQDYKDNLSKFTLRLHNICLKGGFDRLDEPVFLTDCGSRYMTLDYVKENLIK